MAQYRPLVPQSPLLEFLLGLRLLPVVDHRARPEVVSLLLVLLVLLPLLQRRLPVFYRHHCQCHPLSHLLLPRHRLDVILVLLRLWKVERADMLFLQDHRHCANHSALPECSAEH